MLLEKALALCPLDHKPRDWVLSILGMIVRLQGDDKLALALLEESNALARSWGDAWIPLNAAPYLADLARRRGEMAQAAALLRGALAMHADQQSQPGLARCLEGTASLAATMGQCEHAARLLGVAEALREQIGRPLDHPLRPAYDRLVATICAALGDAPCAATWNAGRALPLAMAVAEANALLTAIETGSRLPALEKIPIAANAFPETRMAVVPPAAGPDLTFREQEVLALLCQRLTDAEIAQRLFLSPRTASRHVGNILAKLGAANRRAAAAIAVRRRLV